MSNQQLQRQINSLKKSKSFAFAMYYKEKKDVHLQSIELYETHKRHYEELQKCMEPPVHIINELKEQYEKDKKVIECPICLDVIAIDNLEFSSCLHKYCKTCLDQLKNQDDPKCALCRKKIYTKQ